jgi:hypothetical protein
MMKSNWRGVGFALLLATPIFVGCGGGGDKQYKVKGKLHRGGEVLRISSKVPGGSQIEVGFYPMDAGSGPKDPKIIKVDPDTGTFDMSAAGDKGIPAGKYKVAVHQYDPRPEDKLKGAWH